MINEPMKTQWYWWCQDIVSPLSWGAWREGGLGVDVGGIDVAKEMPKQFSFGAARAPENILVYHHSFMFKN